MSVLPFIAFHLDILPIGVDILSTKQNDNVMHKILYTTVHTEQLLSFCKNH